MDEPKAPDDNRDWNAIDIYLFNNGQEASPPRKYHLNGDQLEWWNITLTHIAKAQFGEVHSEVDLYTVDGNRIDNPIQLKNGAAYVAVLPPETFIDGRYEKYLLKATRSWEKSQLRRESSIVVIKPDEVTENRDSDVKINSAKVDNTEENLVPHMIIKNNSNNNTTITINPKKNDKIERPNAQRFSQIQANISNVNKIQERKHSYQSPTIIRKFGSNLASSQASTIKPAFKRKDSGNGKQTNVKITAAKDKITASPESNKFKNKINNRPTLNKFKAAEPTAVLSKVEEISQETRTSSNITAYTKDKATASVSNNNKQKPETKVYNNLLSDEPSVFVNTKMVEIPQTEISKPNDIVVNENKQIAKVTGDEIEGNVDNIERKTFSVNQTQTVTEVPLEVINSDTDKQYFINTPATEEIVNVNLNIQIWNHGNNSAYRIHCGDENNVIKLEKASQPDIDNQRLSINKSWQEMLEKELNAKDDKKVIVKCSCLCRCNGINNKNEIEAKGDNKEYLIFLPILQLDRDLQRCNCKKDQEIEVNTSVENKRSSRLSNIATPVRKTASCMSLIRAISVVENKDIQIGEDHSPQTNLVAEIPKEIDKTDSVISKRKSVVIYENQNELVNIQKEPSKCSKGNVPELSGKTDITVIKKESLLNVVRLNKSTQTEWNDVMLEAILEQDGHYSFHLPTLASLKNYNKIYTR